LLPLCHVVSGSAYPITSPRFGPFWIVEQIGRGRVGPVFRARDERTDQTVALKLFTIELTAEHAHRLVGEFEHIVAADLAHPTIVRPLGTGVVASTPYLVQEYVSGGSLDSIVGQKGRIAVAEALRIATELAGAIDFAAVGHVHHGALHLTDVLPCDLTRATGFGVAQAIKRAGVGAPRRDGPAVTDHGHDSRIDRETDIVALARIVHELLFSCPFGAERAAVVPKQEIEWPGPIAVRRVFDRVLDGSGDDRFHTALDFVAALIVALEFEPAPAAVTVGEPDILRTDRQRPEESDLTASRDLPLNVADAAASSQPDDTAPSRSPFDRDLEPVGVERGASGRRIAVAAALVAIAAGAAVQYRNHHERTTARDAAPVQDTRRLTRAASASEDPSLDPALAAGTRTRSKANPVTPSGDRRGAVAKGTAVTVGSASSALGDARPSSRATSTVAGGTDDSLGGMLFVDSHPRGAAVFVDDKPIGTTPLAVSGMVSGEHTVRIESEGYRVWSSSVRVLSDRLTKISATLDQ
jgi:PEGA domain-containing protein/protein kinase-like protein